MITLEKLISGQGEISADALADAIIALMQRAYAKGHEAGYEEGFHDGAKPLTDKEILEAFEQGQEEGYARGREDGYDEACMDLTDDDPGSSLHEEEMTATGCRRG